MPTLSNFELVLVNGEVVRQDVGYNSMLGQLEPENWFWFDERLHSTTNNRASEIIEEYKKACERLPWAQSNGKNIHIVNVQIPEDNYSVMCIPAKSILCIRKIEPYGASGPHGDGPLGIEETLEETVQEETPNETQPRQSTFERIRRPVIRRKNDKTGEGGSSDGGRTDRVASHDVSEENS